MTIEIESGETIYCDEAGFTGGDLLNTQQRFFVYGSTDVTEECAAALIDEMVSRFRLQRENELKGANLVRNGKGRMALKWLMGECRGHFHVVYSEKLYAIAAKFFEAFFEPLIASHSLLFYRNDFQRFIANGIYLGLRTRDPLTLSAIENTQLAFGRNENEVTQLFDPKQIRAKEFTHSILEFVRLNADRVGELLADYKDRSLHKWYLDLSLATLHTTLIYWSSRHKEMAVLCDESKPIFESKDIAILSGLAAEGLTILYPNEVADYKVTSLDFGNSQKHPSIELADLVASSVCSALNRSDRFFDDILEEHPEAFGNFNVRPATDFIDMRTERALRNAYVLLLLIEVSKGRGGFALTDEVFAEVSLIYRASLDDLLAK